MAGKNAPGYTKRTIPFKNWIENLGLECPVCESSYITVVETAVSLIYVHRYGVLCEKRTQQ